LRPNCSSASWQEEATKPQEISTISSSRGVPEGSPPALQVVDAEDEVERAERFLKQEEKRLSARIHRRVQKRSPRLKKRAKKEKKRKRKLLLQQQEAARAGGGVSNDGGAAVRKDR